MSAVSCDRPKACHSVLQLQQTSERKFCLEFLTEQLQKLSLVSVRSSTQAAVSHEYMTKDGTCEQTHLSSPVESLCGGNYQQESAEIERARHYAICVEQLQTN